MAWAIYISFAGALISALLPKAKPEVARLWALAVAVAGLAIAIAGFAAGMGQGRQVFVDALWVPSMGIHYLLAADGISRVLVLLTGIASVAGVLFSWNIELRTNQFFAFYLALIGGVYGVFLSGDLFLLFVFYEIAIVPKYFPHLHLGFHAPRIRRHEARALLLRRLGHGAHRPARGLRHRRAATPPRSPI
jgi:NADH-quinone oxidoreductase subunit M